MELNKSIASEKTRSLPLEAQQIIVNDILTDMQNHHQHICTTDKGRLRPKHQLAMGVAAGVFIMSIASSLIAAFSPGTHLPDNNQCKHMKEIINKLGRNQQELQKQLKTVSDVAFFNVLIINLLAEKQELLGLLKDFEKPSKFTRAQKNMVTTMLQKAQ